MISLKNFLKRWIIPTLSLSLLVACNVSSGEEDVLLDDRLEQDIQAYELASTNGSVEALGNYVKIFPDGKSSTLADAEAWRVTKREDSTEAYKTYLDHFPMVSISMMHLQIIEIV